MSKIVYTCRPLLVTLCIALRARVGAVSCTKQAAEHTRANVSSFFIKATMTNCLNDAKWTLVLPSCREDEMVLNKSSDIYILN